LIADYFELNDTMRAKIQPITFNEQGQKKIICTEYIRQRYQGGRIWVYHLEVESDSVGELEKTEREELIIGLEQFDAL